MASIDYTITRTANPLVYIVSWLGLDDASADTDNGTAFDVSLVPGAGGGDRSVQIIGTFGTSTVAIQGSNDGGTTWASLTDPQGNVIEKTAAALEAVTEYTAKIRPYVSGGTTSDVDVYLIVRGAH